MERLGVDIGGVIIDPINDNTDTSFFGDNYLATTAVPGVFEALDEIVKSRFAGEAFIVSKCGTRVQEKSLNWLEHQDFASRTGISVPEQVKFCRKRSGKAPIARELGLTHFIDDKLEVLGYLVGIVENLYLFNPRESEVARHSQFLPHVIVVRCWPELQAHILGIAA